MLFNICDIKWLINLLVLPHWLNRKDIWCGGMIGRNVRQVVLYQICEIGADPKFNMPDRANYVLILWFKFQTSSCKKLQSGWIVSLQKLLLDGPVLNLRIVCWSEIQNGCHDSSLKLCLGFILLHTVWLAN